VGTRRQLSKTDRNVLRQFINGDISAADAAQRLSVSLSGVYRWARRIAPQPGRLHRRKLSKTDVKVLRQFIDGDISAADAAKRVSFSVASVYVLADRIAPDRPRRPRPGKVAAAMNAVEAQRLYEDGWTLSRLGTQYGVSRESVRQQINTDVPVRNTPYQRTCNRCGQPFLGAKKIVICESCKVQNPVHDQCECGRRKRRMSPCCKVCSGCRQRKYSWDAAASLYRAGYGLIDIAGLFRVRTRAICCALIKLGVTIRSKSEGRKAARRARERRSIQVALRACGMPSALRRNAAPAKRMLTQRGEHATGR